nr:MAG TPA: hypothetical protein [Crassvirales sp.]
MYILLTRNKLSYAQRIHTFHYRTISPSGGSQMLRLFRISLPLVLTLGF